MLLGFKPRFVPFVQDHSKTHTVRAFGKRRPFREGDICDCYANVRQKNMALIGRWPCVKVERIRIATDRTRVVLRVWIEGIELTPQEKDAFAWRDGFRSRGSEASPDGNFEDFTSFWEEQHGRKVHAYIPPLVAFEGQVIHWNPSFHVSRTRGAWI